MAVFDTQRTGFLLLQEIQRQAAQDRHVLLRVAGADAALVERALAPALDRGEGRAEFVGGVGGEALEAVEGVLAGRGYL